MLKADLHVHTVYSPDSLSSPEAIVQCCLKVGINCLAITDHNSLAGARAVKKIAPFPIIAGEEIKTKSGEVIGFFLEEQIPKGLSAEETAIRIKEQKGLVCIPHPFDRVRRSPLRSEALEMLLPYIDIIEVFNSRTTFLSDCRKAQELAQKHGFLQGAGSDAHALAEIGGAYVEMPEFKDRDQFLSSLRQGRIAGKRANPLVHFASTYAKLRKAATHSLERKGFA